MVRAVDMAELSKALNDIIRLYDHYYRQLLNEYQINASTINLINAIQGEVMTLTDITEATGLDKSTVSRQMNILVKKEFAVKTNGEDKRYTLFRLTEKAEKAYWTINQAMNDYFSESLDNWSEEEKQMLLVLLRRLNHSLSRTL